MISRVKTGWLVLPLIVLFNLSVLTGWINRLAPNQAEVSGVVEAASGPLAGARVRIRATENSTFTDAAGQFRLTGLAEGEQVEVAAWADGYYIANAYVTPPASGVKLILRPYHTSDHSDYTWSSPVGGEGACSECHPMLIDQWIGNAHGRSINNPRFFSLYNGTNLSATLPVGPGYLKDFPNTDGNCANCHAPGLAVDGYLTTNMNDARGLLTAGIHCDFCHKVGGVFLDPLTDSVYANSPGVQSLRMLRPPVGDNIFFGPYDDIKDPDTYLPEISESRFCAPCHQFSFWGQPIYESYNEWLASSFAQQGTTCQDCHMPPSGDVYFALPEMGGLPHPPKTIPAHFQLGAANQDLLQDTLKMTVTAKQTGGQIRVTVSIRNTGAGHHVPTDFPGRHLLLTIQATNPYGQALIQAAGPQVPEWGGPQAHLPGEIYARVLKDAITGEYPVVSYWKRTQLVTDSRIPADDEVRSEYVFSAQTVGDQVLIAGELRFRRHFQEAMELKEWNTPDILMEELSATLTIEPWWNCFLPLVTEQPW